jgi:hypothetical protein
MATRDRVTSVLSWQAPEFYFYPKSTAWYFGIFGIGAIAAAILWWIKTLDWTNGLLIIVGLFVLSRFASRPPRTIQIKIEEKGIQIGDSILSYDQLASYHLTNHGSHVTLDFQTKNLIFPVSAVINGQNPDIVRDVIGRYLPEKTTGTNYIADLMSRWLHF